MLTYVKTGWIRKLFQCYFVQKVFEIIFNANVNVRGVLWIQIGITNVNTSQPSLLASRVNWCVGEANKVCLLCDITINVKNY